MDEADTHLDGQVHAELSRDLGLISALAIGTGTMIAAGIFTLSGLAISYVGSAAIASFLLAALVASLTALSYCELASIYPQSGEGYLYARKTFSPPTAYFVGWCLLLGYTSSCGFYIASLSTYFNEFIWHLPYERLAGLIFLAALTLLNLKGTKESGTFQVVVTAAKIILLLWFVSGGLPQIETQTIGDRFSTDPGAITSTAALVFITFFGFSAIAASAGEVRNPTKTVPRAIFISMIFVTVLYSAVVLVIVTANLTEYTESAMGVAARAFLGPVGGMVIVLGALFSMISASNASIIAGSRVAMSMSRRRHLPHRIGSINARTGTPIVALVLVGAAIGGFALALPLESLAHFADCVLLIALTLVNVALIRHRRQFPDLERPFRVPLVPLLPALGIAANIYLLVQIPLQGHIVPVALAGAALLAGIVGFLIWKGTEFVTEAPEETPSRLLAERSAPEESAFRVLVPIANPGTANALVDLAGAIAAPRQGEIVLLRVVLVPDQLQPRLAEAYVQHEEKILAASRKRALAFDIPVSSQVRVGRNAGRAILEAAHQGNAKLIVLGWKGRTSTARRILGEITDHVVNHATTDIIMVRLGPDRRPKEAILVATDGGIHATRAEDYAALVASSKGASMTLCAVVSPDESEARVEQETARLEDAKARLDQGQEVTTKVLRHRSPSRAIIAESTNYGAIFVGATHQSFTTRVLFGTMPEEVARRSKCSVIVVKRHEPVRALFGRIFSE